MARFTIKNWKFFVHAIGIIITIHCINERLNIMEIVKFERHLTDIKHILIWTDLPGVNSEGQTHFIQRKCSKFNCFITKDRTLFDDVSFFDAVIFNVADLGLHKHMDIPKVRGVNQVYIFAANDSADKFPVCDSVYDGFFNWTWTYRHDSTIPYRFISIYNNRSEELGSHFLWNPLMDPIDPKVKSLLTTKYKAAVTVLDKCKSHSNREGFIEGLQQEMDKYNLTLDIFGECGTRKCKRRSFGTCNWMLKNQYFFFLALEDSVDHDFVTDVVLRGYNNNAVPVVYGGAKYNQYLPPSSYIDALQLGLADTAKKIYESIKHRERYYDFFKWRNHFQIKASTPLDACALCEKLGERPRMGRASYDKFRKWWMPRFSEKCWIASISEALLRPRFGEAGRLGERKGQ